MSKMNEDKSNAVQSQQKKKCQIIVKNTASLVLLFYIMTCNTVELKERVFYGLQKIKCCKNSKPLFWSAIYIAK